MLIKYITLCGIFSLFIFSSLFSQEFLPADFVPANAKVVVGFRLDRLTAKTDLNLLKKSTIFQTLIEKLGKETNMKALIYSSFDSNQTFIRFEDPVYLYGILPETGLPEDIGLVFSLKDPAILENYLMQNGFSFQTNDPVHTAFIGKTAAGWTSNTGIILSDGIGGPDSAMDTVTNTLLSSNRVSLLSNIGFSLLQNQDWEISAWVDALPTVSFTASRITNDKKLYDSIISLGSSMKGVFSTLRFTFSQGEIILDGDGWISNSIENFMDEAKNPDTNLLLSANAHNLIAAMMLGINLPNVRETVLKLRRSSPNYERIYSSYDKMLSRINMTFDELVSTFTGDIAVSLADYNPQKGSFSLYAAADIVKPKNIAVILDSLEKEKLLSLQKNGNFSYYQLVGIQDLDLSFFTKDNQLIIATKDVRDYILKKKKPPVALSQDIKQYLGTNMVSMHIDTVSLFKMLPSSFLGDFESMFEGFQSTRLTVNPSDSNRISFELNFKLINKNLSGADYLLIWIENNLKKEDAKNRFREE